MRYVKAGRCTRYGVRPREAPYSCCEQCALAMRRYQRRRRALLRELGLCVGCKRRVGDGGSWCVGCCRKYGRSGRSG